MNDEVEYINDLLHVLFEDGQVEKKITERVYALSQQIEMKKS